MVWERIKKLVGTGKTESDSPSGENADVADAGTAKPAVAWINAEDNPWRVSVLDVRPLTYAMVSTSADPQCATNAISYGEDDGTVFIGDAPKVVRIVPSSLTFPVDQILVDGVLFVPRQMEHKWAIFYHQEKIICVRSWQRQVAVIAHVKSSMGSIRITEIQGVFCAADEDPDFTERTLDYLLRSHVLGLPYPAPLPPGMGAALNCDDVALWCFSLYGNLVAFAAEERIEHVQPSKLLRTHSVLHIAVARGDLDAVKACLAQGRSTEVLAGDGLAPLHWALARPEVTVMEVLLAHGSPVDIRSEEGATPLMNAVQMSKPLFVSFLLERGAEVDARDLRGFTSLHRAAEMGHLDVAKILIAAGASPFLEAEGHSALTLAEGRGELEMIKLLRTRLQA